MRRSVSLMAVVCALVACGDDSLATDRGAASDFSTGPDSQLPAADRARTDGGSVDHRLLADARPGVEAGGPASLEGSITLSPKITCSSAPASDCKGVLFVGVVDKPLAPPQSNLLGSLTISDADLAGGQVKFAVTGLKSGTTVYLSAMLVETGPVPSPLAPQSGDLVTKPKPVVLKGGTTTANLELDVRWQ